MGSTRPRPLRLAEKLLIIRNKLDDGLSQNELIKRMGLADELAQDRVSKFERGVLEPPLHILCAYAEIANIFLEVLVKDNLNLPEKIPSKIKSEGIKLIQPE